jgi:hypothetical protein
LRSSRPFLRSTHWWRPGGPVTTPTPTRTLIAMDQQPGPASSAAFPRHMHDRSAGVALKSSCPRCSRCLGWRQERLAVGLSEVDQLVRLSAAPRSVSATSRLPDGGCPAGNQSHRFVVLARQAESSSLESHLDTVTYSVAPAPQVRVVPPSLAVCRMGSCVARLAPYSNQSEDMTSRWSLAEYVIII